MRKREKSKLWTKVFGVKIGDLIRLPYGKVDWEVYYTCPQFIKLRRWRRRRTVDDSWAKSWYKIYRITYPNQEMRKVGHIQS